MIAAISILVLFGGGTLAWLLASMRAAVARWICLVALLADLALLVVLASRPAVLSGWLDELSVPWIPRFGIRLHFAVDGLSLSLAFLTVLLGLMGVLSSWSEIRERVGFFHFNLMWTLAGVLGVFFALDLFAFIFFWEMMLVPMYLLIGIWGHEGRSRAALKFFIFTQAGGLFLLAAILGLYFIHYAESGVLSFDYADLLGTAMSPHVAAWLFAGFFVGFAVKLPVVPLHTWLPDAHTEAPTAGSVILAGLLLKTGAYGLIRFAVPLFPEAARQFATPAMVLGAVGVLYGAVLAWAQSDVKRLVAYSSVSHLGFVLVGIFAGGALALQGAVVQMIAHGLSTGALFMLVGALQERIHTREFAKMGGLWGVVPRMGAMLLLFSMASLGLPGLGNFIGEILVIIGVYRVDIGVTVATAAGLIFATVYALKLAQHVLYGPDRGLRPPDLVPRELAASSVLVVAIVWLGLSPQPLLRAAASGLRPVARALGALP
jgi:NADH-quinone oxidoreductase subunit M